MRLQRKTVQSVDRFLLFVKVVVAAIYAGTYWLISPSLEFSEGTRLLMTASITCNHAGITYL
jgi:hypothetical protein